MEVVSHDKKEVLWEVVNDNVVEEATDNENIGLRVLYFNMLYKDKKMEDREGSSQFPYLLMLTKLWPVYWNNKLNRMNQNMY